MPTRKHCYPNNRTTMKILTIAAAALISIAPFSFAAIPSLAVSHDVQEKNNLEFMERYAVLRVRITSGQNSVRAGAHVLITARIQGTDTYLFWVRGVQYSASRSQFDWE